MTTIPNPLDEIADLLFTLSHQSRRLRATASTFDAPGMPELRQLIKRTEEQIDEAAIEGCRASAVFDLMVGQMTLDREPPVAIGARRIEDFAEQCRDHGRLVESLRGMFERHDETEWESIIGDLAELRDKLAELERLSNRTAAKLSGV